MKLRDACPDGFAAMQRIAAEASMPDMIEIPAVPVDVIEAAASEEGKARKLPTYTMTAYTGGLMRLNGWYHPVVIALESMALPREGDQFPNLLGHDRSQIVGHAETWERTQKTLKIAGVISGTGPAAAEVVGNAANGFKWKASVGCAVLEAEFIEAGQSVKVNGMNHAGPCYVALKTELNEVSFVPIGADNRSSVRVAASAAEAKFRHWSSAQAEAKFRQWLDAQVA